MFAEQEGAGPALCLPERCLQQELRAWLLSGIPVKAFEPLNANCLAWENSPVSSLAAPQWVEKVPKADFPPGGLTEPQNNRLVWVEATLKLI